MKKRLLLLCAAICALAFAKPVPVIFDTDMGNDIDDALALCMLHSLQSMGKVDLLAVTVNKDNPYAPVYCDIINTFYGHTNIPVGFVKDSGITPDNGPFAAKVAKLRDADGRYTFARRGENGDDFPNATYLLRELLAKAEDNSVVMIVVGFSTNMIRLLNTPADAISPLTGTELFAKKVKFVSIMAGDFSEKPRPEYNVKEDVTSAREFYRDCPVKMVFLPWAVGRQVEYPWSSIENDFKWARIHPVAEGFKYYRHGKIHDRPVWDLMSILVAAYEPTEFYTLSKPGTVAVYDRDGRTKFTESADGKHTVAQPLTDEQQEKILKTLIELSSRPRDTTHP